MLCCTIMAKYQSKTKRLTGKTKAKAVHENAPIKLINKLNLGTKTAIIAVNKTSNVLVI